MHGPSFHRVGGTGISYQPPCIKVLAEFFAPSKAHCNSTSILPRIKFFDALVQFFVFAPQPNHFLDVAVDHAENVNEPDAPYGQNYPAQRLDVFHGLPNRGDGVALSLKARIQLLALLVDLERRGDADLAQRFLCFQAGL